MNGNTIKLLSISGSLRELSSNSAILHAAAAVSPANVEFDFYDGLNDLPHFNPDIDGVVVAASVVDLRKRIKDADGVIVCTPEYAHGVPGVLKNALDWIVSSGEFMYKPTAVISASPSGGGGEKAHASLLLTLKMLTAHIVEGGTLLVPFVTTKLKEGVVTDPETLNSLKSLVDALIAAVHSPSEGNPI
jgi:NAD(P)H-dependent FMN reductase